MVASKLRRTGLWLSVLAGLGVSLCASPATGQYWVDTSSAQTDRPPGAVLRPWTSPRYLTWGPYADLHNSLNVTQTISGGVVINRFIDPTIQRSWQSLYGRGRRASTLGVFTSNLYRRMMEINNTFYSYKQTKEPRQKIFASGYFEPVRSAFTYDKAYKMYGAGQLRTPVGQQETLGLHYKHYFYKPGSFVVSRSTAPPSFQPAFTKLVTDYVYSPMKADQPWRGPQLTRLGVYWKWRDYGGGNVSILQPNR